MTTGHSPRFALAWVLLAAPWPARAGDDAPPAWLESDFVGAPATMTRDLVRELHLGSHVLRFEESTLTQIHGLVGSGQVGHEGDAADSTYWLCYSLPGQLVWFVSTEMGGGELLMRVVACEASESDPRRKVCPEIPAALRPIALQFGWIGTSESSVHATLGKPSETHDDRQVFLYLGKQAVPDQERVIDYDVMASIEIEVAKGRVVALEASHLTSN